MVKNFLVNSSENLKEALFIINKNAHGVCFVIDDQKRLVGVLTDGDIRRALIKNKNLDEPIEKIMNRDFVAMHVDSPTHKVRDKISSHIKFIPLLNSDGQVVDISSIRKTHSIPLAEVSISNKEIEYVNECLDSGWISSKGKYVTKFENEFERLHPEMTAVAVSNGTVALQLAMMSIGIGKGDEVIVPDVTFVASVNTIIHCGAIPVLCEVNPETWCIEPKEAEKLINNRTKAIMAVHLYGQAVQMDEISELSNKNNLYLIEDCAEALGTQWRNKNVGTFGHVSTFSFFGNKTITTGEGGMVLFKNAKHADRARILRDHGMNPSKRYWHDTIGYNFRLTNIQAAIGVAQLEKLEEIIQKKIHIGDYYSTLLKDTKIAQQIPKKDNNVKNSYWIFSFLLDKSIDREKLMKDLLRYGVETRPVFYPIHEMPPYKKFKKSDSLNNSNDISRSGLSLPSFIDLSDEKIEHVVSCLHKSVQAQTHS